MFDRLFSSGKKTAPPAGQRIYAIGDIHGCLDELHTLLDLIKENNASLETASMTFSDDGVIPAVGSTLVFLGDYVDRGPDSKGVIDALLAIKNLEPQTVFLKGNHEAAMLDFIDNPEDMFQWLDWGGEATLESYGVEQVLGRSPEDLAAEFCEKLPAAHEEFIRSLALTYSAGDYFFVHAGIRPGVALADQQEEDLLWIRRIFHNAPTKDRPEQVIVHGHEPMKKPQDAGWRIGVDTGACWSGMLTAVMLEGEERRFISTPPR